MARKLMCFSIALSLMFPGILFPPPTRACGPFFPVTIFVHTKHPDLPLKKFAEGNLGVLQPSYARSYLVVAYRYLSGGSFSARERKQLLGLWAQRLDRKEEWIAMRDGDSQANWLQTRKRITGLKDPEYVDKTLGGFPTFTRFANQPLYYENCLDDAFQTAEVTLRARARQFGAHSSFVRSWVKAQDTVFNNCFENNSSEDDFFAPDAANGDLPPLLRADREYQLGAAQFYAHHWKEAQQTFARISQNQDSPWRKISAVVAVRCAIRGASATDDPVVLRNAETRLRVLDADPAMRDLRPAIRRLLGYLETRTSPERRVLSLAKILEKNTYPDNLYRDLAEYTIILDRVIGDCPYDDSNCGDSKSKRSNFEKTSHIRKQDDMTDWIFTYQAEDKAAASHAVLRWKERGTVPWLLAALTKLHPDSPGYAALRDAAAQVTAPSNAHFTLIYHRARLLKEAGQVDAARDLMDGTLPSPELASLPSSKNAFLASRMMLARSLEEFARLAPRRPALVTSDEDGLELPPDTSWCKGSANDYSACKAFRDSSLFFDSETAVLLTERFPLRVLTALAQQTGLPAAMRLQVAKTAFTRAALLSDEASGQEVATILKKLAPQLQNALDEYENSDSGKPRQFAALNFILRQPEMHPYVSAGVGRETPQGKVDGYRDNWWCSLREYKADDWDHWDYYRIWTGMQDDGFRARFVPNKTELAFMDEADRTVADTEWQKLSASGSAIQTIAEPVLAWINEQPSDIRAPEALHNLVRLYRYGCAEPAAKNYSKIAFELLHKKYPNSEWTKKTPYWF